MISRYANPEITEIWSDQHKYNLWQQTELAVLQARITLARISPDIYHTINLALTDNPIDMDWINAKEKETKHDLNAFLLERLRFIPAELQQYFHQGMTSYDTEEPAFASMIFLSAEILIPLLRELLGTLDRLALEYRYTPMMGVTHGQAAEVQTFGKRCLSWRQDLDLAIEPGQFSLEMLSRSKLSGAVGNYTEMDPELEKMALDILGFEPYYGATQIVPRVLFVPYATTLYNIVAVCTKIATDIRLGARSPRPIYQEPFGKNQMGSSAMPHKKNTIATENIGGMERLARANLGAILDNIQTWEERDICQSSVERVVWPDLFHISANTLARLTKVLAGLKVYPDHMLLDIDDTRGCYASAKAKEVLAQLGLEYGLSREDCYRIVQLAAFNAHDVGPVRQDLRNNPPDKIEMQLLERIAKSKRDEPSLNIRFIIVNGILESTDQLGISQEQVADWNFKLSRIFYLKNKDSEGKFKAAFNTANWEQVFDLEILLKGEEKLFDIVYGKRI